MTVEQWITLIREVGFPAAVSVFCLSICGAVAWSMHQFLTTKLVDVLRSNTSALQADADRGGEIARELERLSDKIEDCPGRELRRWRSEREPAAAEQPAAAPTI